MRQLTIGLRNALLSARVSIRPGIALLAVTIAGFSFAQEAPEAAAKPLKLFESGETLDVEITAPWRRLIREINNENPWPAQMTWTDETGQVHTVDITVERRGLTRQQVCNFPPIRLRMDKAVVKGTTFRGQKSLKMVTHCDKGDRWEQYYIKEMLAYLMFNRVTDLSFRVRPLAVRYVESEGGASQSPKFAFVIEDDGDVAKRNGLKKIEVFDIEPTQIEAGYASQYSLFQYMIGNVDWASLGGPGSEKCCHNAKMIGADPAGSLIPVPYDFDSAGLVDAHYAAPPEGLPIRNVTDRLFRGFCVHNSTLENARQQFLALEPEMFALVDNESRLSSRNGKIATRFLQAFFDTLKDDRAFQKEIIGKCRK